MGRGKGGEKEEEKNKPTEKEKEGKADNKKGSDGEGGGGGNDKIFFIIIRVLWAVSLAVACAGLSVSWSYLHFTFDCDTQDHPLKNDAINNNPLWTVIYTDQARIDEVRSGCSSCTYSQVAAIGVYGAQIGTALAVCFVLTLRVGVLGAVMNLIFIVLLLGSIVMFGKANKIYPQYLGKQGQCAPDKPGDGWMNPAEGSSECPSGYKLQNPGKNYQLVLIVDILVCIILLVVSIVFFVLRFDNDLETICFGRKKGADKEPLSKRIF